MIDDILDNYLIEQLNKNEKLLTIKIANITLNYNDSELKTYLKSSLEPYFIINDPDLSYGDNIILNCLSVDNLDFFSGLFKNAETIKHTSVGYHIEFSKQKIKLGDKVIFRSENSSTIVIENINNRTIFVLANSNSYLKDVKRILRDELLYNELEMSGSIPLHAGVLVKNGVGIMMLGDKGKGKTTTTLALLEKHQTSFLSNDLAFVKVDNNNIYAKGGPESIRIGIGTLFANNKLNRYIPEKYKELNISSPELWNIDEKVELEWYDLANEFEIEINSNWAQIQIALFPNINRNKSGVSISKLSKDELSNKLLENVLSPYHLEMSPWLKIVSKDKNTMKRKISYAVEKISENICGYTLEYSGDINSVREEIKKLYKPTEVKK